MYDSKFFKTPSVKMSYKDDVLIDEKGETVMMGWEKPIMKVASEVVTANGGDILNIGFGMGIVDSYIQETNPTSHTIIESHPDVIQYMKDNGWEDRCNCVYGRWQDCIDTIGQFDGIYLDTWKDERVSSIPKLLETCLKDGGVFSMWHQQWEFNQLIQYFQKGYDLSYRKIENNNIIPEKQFTDGTQYISSSMRSIIIPVVKEH